MHPSDHPLQIPVCWVGQGLPQFPTYQTPQSAGMDLQASLAQPMTLHPGQRMAIPTGIAIALPCGYEGQIRPRSGLALRHGITVLNSPGTIDADYRGELQVILIHLGEQPYTIQPCERIAQLVIAPTLQIQWTPVETLDETSRGTGGFGSTG